MITNFRYFLDREGKMEQASPGWRETCGQDPADLRGRFVSRAIYPRVVWPGDGAGALASRQWNFTPILSGAHEVLAVAAIIVDLHHRGRTIFQVKSNLSSGCVVPPGPRMMELRGSF